MAAEQEAAAAGGVGGFDSASYDRRRQELDAKVCRALGCPPLTGFCAYLCAGLANLLGKPAGKHGCAPARPGRRRVHR